MTEKNWGQMKDKAQQMTLTIRTVDGWQLRVTERAESVLTAIEVVKPDSFVRITQKDMTYWIKPMHVSSITISDG